MKRYFLLAALLVVPLLTSCRTVPAGHRGILVYMLGSDKGIEQKELGVGRHFVWFFTQELYIFPVFQQNVIWSRNDEKGDRSITFQTKEGLSVSGDFGMSYAIVPDSVSSIFQRYRRGLDEITDVFLRNMVRDALNMTCSEMGIEAVYGNGRQVLLARVDSLVSKQTRDMGIRVDRIYTIGDFRMPQQVVLAINAKIEATQRAQQRENEIRESEAEANKRIAQARGESESSIVRTKAEAETMMLRAKAEADALMLKAKAEADANELRSKSLTPALMQYETMKRWNGALPQVSSGAVPFFNVQDILRPAPNNDRNSGSR